MKAFIYQADLWCEKCAAGLKEHLDAQGKKPINADDESTFDSDNYPKGPFENGGGEADTPQSCYGCKCPLDNPLTADGVKYVVGYLSNYKPEHQNGEILDEWCNAVKNYDLTRQEKVIVKKFQRIRTKENTQS